MKSRFWVLFILMIVSSFLLAQNVITVQDGDINPGDHVTWTSNNEYLLDGLVFVEDGAVLTIDQGTVIRGKAQPTTGDNTSALIIARGGKIMANGTASQPIIFTAEVDNLSDPTDLLPSDRGLWGGLLILGYATINTATGVGQIEGIDPNEPRGQYGGGDLPGGPDDHDDSGVLRYVSIRHGGAEIGAGNEINGVSFGAVGDQTVVDYVEVFANLDDGFEWFGGTVHCKHLVSAFNADDGFDYDEGFRGKGQFWFVIQGEDDGDRCAEQDGGTNPEDGTPFAIPMLANVSYIGGGLNTVNNGSQLMIFRDNAGGKYYNSIFTEYNAAGITIEDLTSGEDSRARLEAGDLVLKNNIWWNFVGNTLSDIAPQGFVADSLAANMNQIVDPQLLSISRTNDRGLDPRPAANGPAASGAMALSDPFFTNVPYYGAFDPNTVPWIRGWTALDQDEIMDIREELTTVAIPGEFTLSQNYPNPFNPSTTIQFSLPQSGNVKLSVYNIRGQQVTTLVNGVRNAGVYSVTWDASNLSSGIYFYRLESGTTVLTKRMTLLK